MLRAGFEPTIPVFEREKTVHALDHAASVIGGQKILHAAGNSVLTGIKQILSTVTYTAGCNRI
jgi:hypothetical protein